MLCVDIDNASAFRCFVDLRVDVDNASVFRCFVTSALILVTLLHLDALLTSALSLYVGNPYALLHWECPCMDICLWACVLTGECCALIYIFWNCSYIYILGKYLVLFYILEELLCVINIYIYIYIYMVMGIEIACERWNACVDLMFWDGPALI